MPLEVTGLRDLIAKIGEAPEEMAVELHRRLTEAAEVVAEQIRRNADFSTYLPGAVETGSSISATKGGATVRVKERGFPHEGEAHVFEGDGIGSEPFRHPVFDPDREVWVIDETHPFAGPAVREKRAEVVALVAAAAQDVANGI